MDGYSGMILYLGSIRMSTLQLDECLELIKQSMPRYKDSSRTKPVLLNISVTRIKICSPDGKVVHMAHALKRISYATCDLQNNHFCFLARQPRSHNNNQFCHIFITKSVEQAEELNSIVGNAFRMAYATQLKHQQNSSKRNLLKDGQESLSSRNTMASKNLENCYFQSKPNSIPGLRVFENGSSSSNQSTPTSDESNSPTELNVYRKQLEKHPLTKRIPISIKDMLSEEGFPSKRPTPEGCPSSQKESPETKRQSKTAETYTIRNLITSVPSSVTTTAHVERNVKSVPISENARNNSNENEATSTFKRYKMHGFGTLSKMMTPMPPPPPPLPPERADSLIKHREENELKSAPWFQAGIPREITLEVLSQEPIGAFMVRESTTKSDCYALSLRVPKEYHPRGIAHYLIIRTNKGYKIKGFTKEFSTLTALITHHSVMQELLPCPLSLSKYNPSITKSDTNKDFEDMDSDPDYNTLADFRKMMADLNI